MTLRTAVVAGALALAACSRPEGPAPGAQGAPLQGGASLGPDPQIGGEQELSPLAPGPAVPLISPGSAITGSDGQDFLVAWSDGRGLFATRVLRDGGVPDPLGTLASPLGAYADPRAVAWDGTAYDVLWLDAAYSPINVHLSRIDPASGALLSSEVLLASDGGSLGGFEVAAAAAGPGQAVVAWPWFVINTSHLRVARLAGATGALGPPLDLTPSASYVAEPAVAHDPVSGSELVTYTVSPGSAGSTIAAALLLADGGTPWGAGVGVSYAGFADGTDAHSAAAWEGSGFRVRWSKTGSPPDGGQGNGLWEAHVDLQGNVSGRARVDPANARAFFGADPLTGQASAGWVYAPHTWVQTPLPDGGLSAPVDVGGYLAGTPTLARASGVTLLAPQSYAPWSAFPLNPAAWFQALLLDDAAQPLAPLAPVSLQHPEDHAPALAWDGRRYLGLWKHQGDDAGFLLEPVAPDGTPDPAGAVLLAGLNDAAAAAVGGEVLVVGGDYQTARLLRVGDGGVLPAADGGAPFVSPRSPYAAAALGGKALVAYTGPGTGFNGSSPHLFVYDPAADSASADVSLGWGVAPAAMRVLALSDRYLLCVEDVSGPYWILRCAAVDAAGQPIAGCTRSFTANLYNRNLALATDGQQVMAVWESASSPYGAPWRGYYQRFDACLAPVDNYAAQLYVNDAATGQAAINPALAFDGSRYLAVWESGGELRGAHLATNGAVAELFGFDLTATPGVTEARPALRAGRPGELLLAYEHLDARGDVLTSRIFGRALHTGAQGGACGSAADCADGLPCVDGVCCASACAEACAACDVPGALGSCVAIPAGEAPHGARGACAGAGPCAARCDGTSTACAFPGAELACPATCSGADLSTGAACDGAGACSGGSTVSCSPGTCDADAGACQPQCTATADCAADQFCDAAQTCQPRRADGSPCDAPEQCLAAACVAGLCGVPGTSGSTGAISTAGSTGASSATSTAGSTGAASTGAGSTGSSSASAGSTSAGSTSAGSTSAGSTSGGVASTGSTSAASSTGSTSTGSTSTGSSTAAASTGSTSAGSTSSGSTSASSSGGASAGATLGATSSSGATGASSASASSSGSSGSTGHGASTASGGSSGGTTGGGAKKGGCSCNQTDGLSLLGLAWAALAAGSRRRRR